jgi:hypothetical protein
MTLGDAPGGADTSERAIRRLLRETESVYDRCVSILTDLKNGRPNDDFPRLQFYLAESLFRLSRAHGSVRGARDDLILRKQRLKPQWFAERQRRLARLEELLVRATGVGRAIGDALAWFFYQNDGRLLDDHRRLEAQELFPGAQGGVATVHLARDVPVLQGYFVLYHDLTSILRSGDLTLVDLKAMRVAGLGEIKAGEMNDGVLRVEIALVGSSKRLHLSFSDIASADATDRDRIGVIENLHPSSKARFDRQYARMRSAVVEAAEHQAGISHEMKEKLFAPELDALIRRTPAASFASSYFGGGLAGVVFRDPGRRLSSRLTATGVQRVEAIPQDVPQCAIETMLPESTYNSIAIGAIQYRADSAQPFIYPGTIPPFWWELSDDSAREVLLRIVTIVTLFNPAHLFRALEDDGFAINDFVPPYSASISHRDAPKEMRLEGIDYFLQLVPYALIREAEVVRLVGSMFQTARERDLDPGDVMPLRLHQTLFPPAGDVD